MMNTMKNIFPTPSDELLEIYRVFEGLTIKNTG